jgi:hypothetical protein
MAEINDFSSMSDEQIQEYKNYEQSAHEAAEASRNMWVRGCVACKKHTQAQARPTPACRHVTGLDEVHPEAIVFLKCKWFLCQTCLELLDRKKLKIQSELVIKCHACVMEEIARITLISPMLFIDHNQE